MIKFTKLFPKNNKKGMTLVELVVGVVVLSIFAIGIITALTTGSSTIAKKAQESAAHSEAMLKMDAVISVVSNGNYEASADIADEVKGVLGYGSEVTLTITPDSNTYLNSEGVETVRGWKLQLTYNGAEVTAYTSNTKGVFDKDV